MGLGSLFDRYEETNSVGFMPLFPDDGEDRYYTRTINQIAASSKSIDSALICSSLLGVNKQVSFAALDKLGGASNTDMEINILDETDAFSVVQSKDPSALFIDNYYVGGGGPVYLYDYVYLYNAYHGLEDAFKCDDDQYYWLIEGKYRRINGGHFSGSNETLSWNITYIAEDDSVSSSHSGSVNVSDKFTVIDYASDEVSSCETPTDIKMLAIYDDELTFDNTTEHLAMTVRYKVGGAVNESRYIKALNARMGIPNREPKQDCDDPSLTPEEKRLCEDSKTLKEALEDPELKTQILTYAVKYEEPFIGLVNSLLNQGGYEIIVPGIEGLSQDQVIRYHKGNPFLHKYVDGNTGFMCTMNGSPITINPTPDEIDAGAIPVDPRYIIPVTYIQKEMILRDRYNTIENGLCWMTHHQTRTKLKWYQTGLFKILTWVVALILALYGQVQLLVMLTASTIVSGVFGDKAGMILGIIMAVWSLGTSLIYSATTTALNTFSMIVRLAASISNLYFSYALDSIREEMNDISDDIKKIAEAVSEMSREMLYIPFSDVMDAIDYTMYELPYAAYEATYDYDKYTKISVLKNYTKG